MPRVTKYSCDFETTADSDEITRVWAFGCCPINNPDDFSYCNSIDGFFKWLYTLSNATLYFHNLKFDGEFILHYLLTHEYVHSDNRMLDFGEFSTLISDKGIFYSMKICLKDIDGRKRYINIYDSLKLLPFKVSEIAKMFNLEIQKLEIDYTAKREINHELTDEEKEYLKHDVQIVAKALDIMFSQKLTKMTIGSNAMRDYKKIITDKHFSYYFPPPTYDADIRQSYKGGFTYVNPKFQNKDIGEGIVLDVNSLYPSVMYNRMLPYYEGKFFTGQYEYDRDYPLYIQMFRASFELKHNYIPTIQLKNNFRFCPTEYVTTSNGDEIPMCLTSVDLELFLKHYNVDYIEYLSGWKFRATDQLFKEYIDKWIAIKNESTISGNKPMRTLAKLMLNSLYGKFATNPIVTSKVPYLEDNIVKYKNGYTEHKTPVYVPLGSFVTAWARHTTITAAQALYDRFIYADTDSLHLVGTDRPDNIEIDDVKLGAWKLENTFTRARFLRAKTYIEDINGNLKVTCAGMPDACHDQVTWENFRLGASYSGKLQPKHINGGIILKDIDFSIKV